MENECIPMKMLCWGTITSCFTDDTTPHDPVYYAKCSNCHKIGDCIQVDIETYNRIIDESKQWVEKLRQKYEGLNK